MSEEVTQICSYDSCGDSIENEDYLTYFGNKYHKHCVKCMICRKSFSS